MNRIAKSLALAATAAACVGSTLIGGPAQAASAGDSACDPALRPSAFQSGAHQSPSRLVINRTWEKLTVAACSPASGAWVVLGVQAHETEVYNRAHGCAAFQRWKTDGAWTSWTLFGHAPHSVC